MIDRVKALDEGGRQGRYEHDESCEEGNLRYDLPSSQAQGH